MIRNSMILRWLGAVLMLPVMVLVIIPGGILYFSAYRWHPIGACAAIGACFFVVIGLLLAISTTVLFHSLGMGTAAPWDPPAVLVVAGPYRYVRNPMISGVFSMLIGEVLISRSPYIAVWFLIFLAAKMVYIPLIEEKHLRKTFGENYAEYEKNVPRWIPRLTSWKKLPHAKNKK
ncbi:MAG: isoprenylcysteine carboxylmethyltransferase family protein [Puniceicoccales bacterium]|nr:isoprenylcysteine carboxylmethyltransferase family protein [Puniceicoccales bacterium]